MSPPETAPATSVLVPVYNREDLIGPCVRSALAQTVTDLEVVVVDNASTDRTWEVCRGLAAGDGRVRVFRNAANLGPVRNWKRCFEEARGRYGKVLFSDDTMAPDFLERTLPFLDDPEVGFVFTSIDMGPEPDRPAFTYWWHRSDGTYPSADFIADALSGIGVPVSPGAGLFRMDDLRKNLVLEIPSPTHADFASHGAGPDVLLYLLTARGHPRVGYVAAPLTFFRTHAGSITMQDKAERIWSHHFQAKVWFAGLVGEDGTWLDRCLAHGWWRRVRRQRRLLSTRAFSAAYVTPPRRIPWRAVLAVWRRRSRDRRARRREARRVPALG